MKKISRTYVAKPADFPADKASWVLVDAEGEVLGRLARRIANTLRGKDKPTFTPHVDTGSFVVVINAEKVKLTGAKNENKIYYTHTGQIGGLKSMTAAELLQKKPDEVIRRAVAGMLPKNRLNRAIIKKLKIYAGPEHPHVSQKPALMEA